MAMEYRDRSEQVEHVVEELKGRWGCLHARDAQYGRADSRLYDVLLEFGAPVATRRAFELEGIVGRETARVLIEEGRKALAAHDNTARA